MGRPSAGFETPGSEASASFPSLFPPSPFRSVPGRVLGIDVTHEVQLSGGPLLSEVGIHRPHSLALLVGQPEAVLALGAPPERVISDYVTTSVRASLIPMVDALKSLGLVYIHGMMSGMILAGANPIYAALYQFVIMGMLFAASGLTSMLSLRLVGPLFYRRRN